MGSQDKASATAVAKNVSDAAAAGVQESDDVIALNDVDIVTPTGVCLAQGIDLNISRGHSLMVTGHNATGKSSLFRVLSGLWPLQKGSLSAPRDQIQLVPQRVYSVSGTLADQITYPKHIDKRSEEDEAKLVAALDYVALKYAPTFATPEYTCLLFIIFWGEGYSRALMWWCPFGILFEVALYLSNVC